MKNTIIFIIVPILAVIIAVVLNFQGFLMSSPVTVKNIFVTFVYLAIWISILIITLKSKNYFAMNYYYLVFWLLTLFFAVITAFANVTEFYTDWAIPFIILLLTPLYGIDILVDNHLTTAIIVASLSLIMFIAFLFTLKKPSSI